MKETIYIKHLWKAKNALEGYEYHRETLSSHRIFSPIYLIVGIISLMLGLYGLLVHFKIKSLFLIAYGTFCLSIEKINLLLFTRRCKKLNYENRQLEWEIDRKKIIYRLLNISQSTFSWDLVKKVLDTPECFLLYPQQNQFYWLPKNTFKDEEDIAQFVYMAQDKVKNWQQID